MLDLFGVTEENWHDGAKMDPHFQSSSANRARTSLHCSGLRLAPRSVLCPETSDKTKEKKRPFFPIVRAVTAMHAFADLIREHRGVAGFRDAALRGARDRKPGSRPGPEGVRGPRAVIGLARRALRYAIDTLASAIAAIPASERPAAFETAEVAHRCCCDMHTVCAGIAELRTRCAVGAVGQGRERGGVCGRGGRGAAGGAAEGRGRASCCAEHTQDMSCWLSASEV
eukprot:1847754-Rhodomonas_salina.2